MTIDKQLSWSLKVGETAVNLCEFDLPHTICSVAEVSKVVKYIDESTFCVGNPDAKFEGLSLGVTKESLRTWQVSIIISFKLIGN